MHAPDRGAGDPVCGAAAGDQALATAEEEDDAAVGEAAAAAAEVAAEVAVHVKDVAIASAPATSSNAWSPGVC